MRRVVSPSHLRFLLITALVAVLTASRTANDAKQEWLDETRWIAILAFVFAFLLAFAVGANDVANSFGTAVGSKVLTMRQAFILASVMETSGAVLLGSKVGETIRKGIVDPSHYTGDPANETYWNSSDVNDTNLIYYTTSRLDDTTLLLYGQLSAMLGAAAWQIIATLCKLPVSGTHSIVGAIVGFHVAVKGWSGIGYAKLLKIVASWFLSPVLAGVASVSLYWFLHVHVVIPTQSLEKATNKRGETLGLLLLPVFYGCTVFINIYALLHHQEDGGFLESVPYPPIISLSCSLVLAIIVGVGSYFIFVKRFKNKWYGGDEKKGTNGTIVTMPTYEKVPSERSDSGYNTPGKNKKDKSIKEPKLNTELIKLVAQNQKKPKSSTATVPAKSTSCFSDVNVMPQAPVLTARLLSHVERNDSFASNRTPLPNCSSNSRVRMLSGGTISLPDQRDSTKTRFYSESSDPGLMMRSPSMRKPTNAGIIEEGDDYDENDLDNEVFMDEGGPELLVMEKSDSEKRIDTLFEKLQIMTACFGSFAHGGNDVSNAIGPLIAVYLIRLAGGVNIPESVFNIDPAQKTPWFLLAYGGLGITVGLWTCGATLIKAMGEDITTITPARGFCIELMSAFTVLAASAVGMPVSTTHCKVGSIVAIGIYGQTGIPKRQIVNIALAWLVTVPASGILSGLIMKFMLLIKPIEF